MTLLRFDGPGQSIAFKHGSSYGGDTTHYQTQVIDRTAAGTLQVEDLGVAYKQKTVVFEAMTNDDYVQLMEFFDITVDGAMKEFTFRDEFNDTYTARFVQTSLSFKRINFCMWAGSFVLECVDA